ncbi:hypothetical protein [Streptomyces sp. SID11385]|uniref:hypothetical protein n=1 Tax=Streptomyces sp. SID11385 TaxID=2706031 RepID=UPI0013CD8C5B|nr:hypothetical protein [Streptomyces sp. SID11385]
MATKTFALRTEPHVAEIGDEELAFHPEIDGDDYLDAYQEILDARRAAGDDDMDAAQARDVTVATRAFLAKLMLPESAERFASMRLPMRIMLELMEWVGDLYGGGRPPTSSTDSSRASRRAGTSGTAPSRSKGSTPARGRSRAS